MKKITFYVGLFLCSFAYEQQQPPPIQYDLKIKDITSKSEAKMITDALRSFINPPENPFAHSPVFDDKRDAFLVDSDREINEDEMRAFLKKQYQLELIYCKKVN